MHQKVLTPEFRARFDSKVAMGGDDDCWPWTGARYGEGYGYIWIVRQKLQIKAHRLAYFYAHGDLPDADILHRCDNPPCCNPRHLWVGTRADNNRDRAAKQRGRESRQWGEANGRATLTSADVAAIRSLVAGGQTQAAVAAQFGVRQASVSRIVRGESRTRG